MSKERIFIVEDEGIVAADLESVLRELEYTVVGIAATGEEAVEKVEKTAPDLVLMDIRLKGPMDGIDAAEQITARMNIPVTFLTAYADESTLARAKTTMPYGYILKPFEERDLRTAVELALYKHKMESMIATMDGWHATALRSVPDAVIATDRKGNITFINEATESQVGWRLTEIHGKRFDDVFGFSIPVEDALDKQTPIRTSKPVSLTTKGGKKLEIQYSLSGIKEDPKSATTGAILVFHRTGSTVHTPVKEQTPLSK